MNDFANSQCAKLMNQIHELKERDTAKRPITYSGTNRAELSNMRGNSKGELVNRLESFVENVGRE